MVMPFSTFMTQMAINFKYTGEIILNSSLLKVLERDRPNRTCPIILPEYIFLSIKADMYKTSLKYFREADIIKKHSCEFEDFHHLIFEGLISVPMK